MRYGLALAGVIAALLVGVSSASAAVPAFIGAGDRNAHLLLAPAFKDSLADAEIKLRLGDTTERSGQTLLLPLADELQPSMSTFAPAGRFGLLGGLIFRGYGKRELYYFNLNVGNGQAGLVGVGEQSLKLARGPLGGQVKPDAGFTGMRFTGLQLKLTADGARALNRISWYDQPSFSAGEPFGRLAFDEERVVLPKGGTFTVTYNSNLVQHLSDCGVTISALDPAAATANGFEAALATGTPTRARVLAGSMEHSGGVRFTRIADGAKFDMTELVYDFTPGPDSWSMVVPDGYLGHAVKLGAITDAPLRGQFTRTGGTLTLSGGTLHLSAATVQTLHDAVGCDIAAGTPLGALSFDLAAG